MIYEIDLEFNAEYELIIYISIIILKFFEIMNFFQLTIQYKYLVKYQSDNNNIC